MAKGLLQPMTRRSSMLVLLETSLILGAVIAGARVVVGPNAWRMATGQAMLAKSLLIVFVCQCCLYYTDHYDDPRADGNQLQLLARLLQALGATALILSGLYFRFPNLIIERGVFAVAAILVTAAVIAWRVTFWWASRRMGPRERLLIVGASPTAIDLARELHRRFDLGVEIVGFVNPVADIQAIVRARDVHSVVVDLQDARGKLPMAQLLDMRLDGITFAHLASVYEEYTGKIAVENLRPSWFIFSSGFRNTRSLQVAKRAVDVVASSIGLICASPFLVVLAALIKATSKGPVLYSQQRVGEHGCPFTLYKLRTMRADAEATTGPVWSRPSDNRVTRIGRVLRSTRLDELPQLWNVLIGDMSLIGPRPERPEFVNELTKQIPFYGQRHVIKPGLSGWAQVRYRYGSSVEDAMQKLQYDLFYVKHMSIAMDLVIMCETLKTMVLHRGR